MQILRKYYSPPPNPLQFGWRQFKFWISFLCWEVNYFSVLNFLMGCIPRGSWLSARVLGSPPLPLAPCLVPHPTPLPSGNQQPSLCFWVGYFFKISHRGEIMQYLSFSAWLNVFQVHPCCCKWRDFLLFYGWIIFHYKFIYHIFFIHSSVHT